MKYTIIGDIAPSGPIHTGNPNIGVHHQGDAIRAFLEQFGSYLSGQRSSVQLSFLFVECKNDLDGRPMPEAWDVLMLPDLVELQSLDFLLP